MKRFDMTPYIGQKFGRWTLLRETDSVNYGKYGYVRMVLCKCNCGIEKIVEFNSLKRGKTTSCGCYGKEWSTKNATKHGLGMLSPGIKHPDYCIWLKIKSRCYNINDKNFKDYGKRGVKMSDSWKNSFPEFIKDMGWRPSKDYSIERNDFNGNYCKENCKWILKKEQPKNTRKVQRIEYNEEKLSLPEWCNKLNLTYSMMRHRIYDLKIPFEKAIFIPQGKKLKKFNYEN